jgi:hypothetical protein
LQIHVAEKSNVLKFGTFGIAQGQSNETAGSQHKKCIQCMQGTSVDRAIEHKSIERGECTVWFHSAYRTMKKWAGVLGLGLKAKVSAYILLCII